MKLNHAKPLLVLLFLIGLACITAVAVFLLMPRFKEDIRLSGEILKAETELEAQYAHRKNLLSSITVTEDARATMKTLATQFLPSGHELDLITAVEDLAGREGVEEHILLTPIEDPKAVPELKTGFDITLNGPYWNVLQAMVDIERLPTLLLVSSAIIHPGAGPVPGGPSFLSVNIRGLIAAPPAGL